MAGWLKKKIQVENALLRAGAFPINETGLEGVAFEQTHEATNKFVYLSALSNRGRQTLCRATR